MAVTTRLPETQRRRRGHNFYPPKAVAARIPRLYGTEDVSLADKVIHLHYFSPSCDWWIAELDPETGEAFGFACLNGDRAMAEWGYVSLPELEAVNIRRPLFAGASYDIVVERDRGWTPQPFARAVPWRPSGLR
ncbi:MAG TPA: DUF2958 domain-containing protein [Verrucomicrobiae bacterium]|nr:DUF2958 domain-containing protein [Verrucomicrobiae bacterium]